MNARNTTERRTVTAVFSVVDALDHPHGGRILRLRLEHGEPPSIRDLSKARLRATTADGDERTVEVAGFSVTGGKPSDERLARTGRVDLHVRPADGRSDPPIDVRWRIEGPLD